MTRRGFALITVLWLLAALGAVTATSLAVIETARRAGQNRVLLLRAGWAREACAEILLARYSEDSSVRLVDTVDLGRGAWCRAELSNTASTLDLNLASPEAVRMVVGNDTLADAVLDWRDSDDVERPLGAEASWYRNRARRLPRNGPFADVAELALVRGFDSAKAAQLESMLTTEGTDQLDVNEAPGELLATLPGLDTEGPIRSAGLRLKDSDQLLEALSPSARKRVLEHYKEFSARAVFSAPRFTARVEAGIRGSALRSRLLLTLMPVGGGLAVTRRKTE